MFEGLDVQRDQRAISLHDLASELTESEAIREARRGARLVFGSGNPTSNVVLIGEAPGAEEEKYGRPFVGRAGRLLDVALHEAGLDRSRIWITNVVKFRPSEPGKGGRVRNRPPTSQEREVFLPWLKRELEIIRPRSVVCLGGTAGAAVFGRAVKVNQERGHWSGVFGGTRALVTYHPAYLLRPFKGKEQRFREMVEDLRQAAFAD